ncbi:MAG: hypothetical protein ACRYHA_27860 [Janthinobacterium lividum]
MEQSAASSSEAAIERLRIIFSLTVRNYYRARASQPLSMDLEKYFHGGV